jgi:hypothetical protein
MQKIWSRALQGKSSCQCPFCATPRSALNRRVNTVPVRQRLGVGDVLTVFYSTALGTAAFYDAKLKEDKRQSLDNAISVTRSEVEALKQDHEARLKALGHPLLPEHEDDKQAESNKKKQIQSKKPRNRSSSEKLTWHGSVQPLEDLLSRFSMRAKPRKIPTSTVEQGSKEEALLLKKMYEYSKRSWDISQVDKDFQDPQIIIHGREAKKAWKDCGEPTVSKLMTARKETTIARLAFRLIQRYLQCEEVQEGIWAQSITVELPTGKTLEMDNTNLPQLLSNISNLDFRSNVLAGLTQNPTTLAELEELPFPKYITFRHGERNMEFYEIEKLNEELRDAFLQKSSPNHLISQLISILLCQTVSPNVQTFNLLIAQFTNLQLFWAAQEVIDAIDNASINHNEISHAVIMTAHTASGEHSRFKGYLNRMNCVDSRGTRSRRDVDICSAQQQSEQFVIQYRYINWPTIEPSKRIKILEKARWNSEIFEASILGWLELGRYDRAMVQLAAMLRNGYKETTYILEAILQHSVIRDQWEIGSSTWERLQSGNQQISTMTYYWMLQLCVSCHQYQRFFDTLESGIRLGKLKHRLAAEDFILEKGQRGCLRKWAFAIRRFEHNISIPDFPNPCDTDLLPPVQLKNLYTTLLERYCQLVDCHKKAYGWFSGQDLSETRAEFESQLLEEVSQRRSKWKPIIWEQDAFDKKYFTELKAITEKFSQKADINAPLLYQDDILPSPEIMSPDAIETHLDRTKDLEDKVQDSEPILHFDKRAQKRSFQEKSSLRQDTKLNQSSDSSLLRWKPITSEESPYDDQKLVVSGVS